MLGFLPELHNLSADIHTPCTSLCIDGDATYVRIHVVTGFTSPWRYVHTTYLRIGFTLLWRHL